MYHFYLRKQRKLILKLKTFGSTLICYSLYSKPELST
jgi:hypothetical protein